MNMRSPKIKWAVNARPYFRLHFANCVSSIRIRVGLLVEETVMKNWILLLAFLLSACGSTAITPESPTPPTATTIPTPRPSVFEEPDFVFQGDDPSVPILTREPSPEIKNLYINPGAVIFHAGQFHMFFNSFTAWPGTVLVGYARSEDGLSWQMVQDEPVFSSEQVEYGNGRADVSSVLVTEDGTWVMYFHTVSSGNPPMVIGRATAASPLGTWSVDAEPLLVPGPEDSWDEQSLFWPNVVKDEEGYRMYYGARDNQANFAIGMATSQDGIAWTKYDDPETNDARYATSDPVLQPSTEWESKKVDRPRVQFTPDGWVMIYQGGPSVEQRGLASSDDGIHWRPYPENPLFTRDTFPIPNAQTWDTSLLYHEGVYYYYMELGSLRGTDLYLATHQ